MHQAPALITGPDATRLMVALRRQADKGNWRPRYELRKFEGDWQGNRRRPRYIEDAVRRGMRPYEVVEGEGNVLCTAGIGRMLDLLIVAGGQGMDHTHCRLAAGDGVTAVAAGDTDLSAAAGSAHRWFNLADSTYPSRATNVLTVRSTFASADGNFVWSEWGIDLGTANANTVTAPLFNHALATLGTKAAGTSWQFTVTVTLS